MISETVMLLWYDFKRCSNFSMEIGDHRRSERVYFHEIALAGVEDVNSPYWKRLSLGGIMKYLGHENVSSSSNTRSQSSQAS